MTPLDAELAELRALAPSALAARFRSEFGREPRSKQRAWLLRRLAFRAQERRLGGLSAVARRRLEALIAEIELPLDQHDRVVAQHLAQARRRGDPLPGTTLTRVWRNRTLVVRVLDSGFDLDGTVHKSLSAVAKVVTGTHWNGRLFFGLAGRGANS